MKRLIILSSIALLLFSSFIFGQNKPAWLENPASVYSNALYLTAIGEGDNRKAAENNATGNLALIFKSDIKVDNEHLDRFKEQFGDKESFQHESNVTKKIKVSSNQTLFNVKFGESFTDNMGKVFVLAYIDKMETAEIYNEKIKANSEKIKFFLNTAEKSDDKLVVYSAYNAASLFSLDNQILKEQLRIISPEFGISEDLGYNENDIAKNFKDSAKNISVSINIENDSDSKATAFIKETINSFGFVINSNPLLTITGSVSYEKLDLDRKEKFVTWNLFINLNDLSGNTIVSTTAKGREGSVSYDAAISRCINQIGKKVKLEFSQKLSAYFDSLVKN